MTNLRLRASLLLLLPIAVCMPFAACNSVESGQSSSMVGIEDAAQVALPEVQYYIIIET